MTMIDRDDGIAVAILLLLVVLAPTATASMRSRSRGHACGCGVGPDVLAEQPTRLVPAALDAVRSEALLTAEYGPEPGRAGRVGDDRAQLLHGRSQGP